MHEVSVEFRVLFTIYNIYVGDINIISIEEANGRYGIDVMILIAVKEVIRIS